MNKNLALAPALLGLLLAHPAAAQQFSADIVGKAGPAGRLYVAGDNARIETPDFPDGFFLIDALRSAAWFVKPAQHRFMEARQSSRLTRLFVPLDPQDPCARWQAMAVSAGTAAPGARWRCERLASGTVAGREAVQFRAEPPGQPPFYSWVAPQLRLALRLRTGEGDGLALERIVEAPQDQGLFMIPPDYRKFDPLRLIERLQHSDVWVEPPK